jgi:WD40 repeat protein
MAYTNVIGMTQSGGQKITIIPAYSTSLLRHLLLLMLFIQKQISRILILALWGCVVASGGCTEVELNQAPIHVYRLVESSLVDGLLSKDAKLAVTLSRHRELIVWDVQTQQAIYRWQAADFSDVPYLVALSADKQHLAAAGKQQLYLFDLKSGTLELNWHAQGFDPKARISSIGYSHSGTQILLGMNEGSVISVDQSSQTLSLFKQHSTTVSHVEFIASGDRVLSVSHDGNALLWSNSSGKQIRQFSYPHRIVSVSLDEANRRLFIADALDNNMIVDSSSGQVIAHLDYLERYRYFRQALFINNATVLITGTSKQEVISWDARSGRELAHWQLTAFTAGTTLMSMAMDAKGKLLTLSSDGALESWSVH